MKQIQAQAQPTKLYGYNYYISEEALQASYEKVKLHAASGNRMQITIGQLELCLKRANEFENFSSRVIEEAKKLITCKKNHGDSKPDIDFYDFSNIMFNALNGLKKKAEKSKAEEPKAEEPKIENIEKLKLKPFELKNIELKEQKSKVFLGLKKLATDVKINEELNNLKERVTFLEEKLGIIGQIIYDAGIADEQEAKSEPKKQEIKPEPENPEINQEESEAKEAINQQIQLQEEEGDEQS